MLKVMHSTENRLIWIAAIVHILRLTARIYAPTHAINQSGMTYKEIGIICGINIRLRNCLLERNLPGVALQQYWRASLLFRHRIILLAIPVTFP
jgi:hypothetical protein